jgi:hypothetical protein
VKAHAAAITCAYPLRGVATSVFIDGNGTIRQVYSRAMRLGEMREVARQLISRPHDTDFDLLEDS